MLGLVLFCIWGCFLPSYGVVVQTEYGQVRGKTMAVNNTRQVKNVDVFRAIPFAKDTSGARRFARPEPVDHWDGIFEADTPGFACPQDPAGTMTGSHPDWDKFSEDCLHLDITSPDVTGGPFPVMVWVYGGAYYQGANVQYPGHFLSMFDVVVVSINYRLGNLGFTFTGNDASPGNAAMWDQKMALEFVVDNIASFGGNPNLITVFGESAGATSVALLMLSPETEGLFQQAMLHSGAETNYWTINVPESQPELYTRQMATDLGCEGDDYALMDCLRQFSWETLVYDVSLSCTPGYYCGVMAPVVDGEGGFLPKTPIELREDGNIMDGPIINSITKDDGALYVMLLIPETMFGCCNRSNFERLLRERYLDYWLPKYDNDTATDLMEAVLYNYTPWPRLYENEENREAIVRIFTDLDYGFDWDIQLRDHQKLAPTYGFIFNYTSERSTSPEWIGVSHGDDVPYVWGYPLISLNPQVQNDSQMTDMNTYTERDIEYNLYIQELLTNFAKYGNPTPQPVDDPLGGSTVWSAYTMDEMNVLTIGNPSIDVIQDYEQKNYAFWREYIPYVATGVPTNT